MVDKHDRCKKRRRKAVTTAELHVLEHFVQPMWIYDFVQERNRWANQAGLALWGSPDIEEFKSRDRTKGRSASTLAKLKQVQAKIEKGGNVETQWTLYPNGVATTVKITITGIPVPNSLNDDDDDDDNNSSNENTVGPEGDEDNDSNVSKNEEDYHYAMLFHAVPVDKDTLEAQSLRSNEMLRHLPMAVCQFDMTGKVMYQNQWALLPTFEDEESSAEGQDENSADDSQAAIHRDFTSRFVDPHVAREALSAIQTTSEEVIHLEAELVGTRHDITKMNAAHNHSSNNTKTSTAISTTTTKITAWSAVALRKTTDPVTGHTVILYSAQDKSDAQAAQRERASRMKKSEFLAIMAHEIRTPLHQVIGFVDLLDQTQDLNDEQRGYVHLLQVSAQTLMTVISDVLDYSKLEAGQMKIECIPYEPRSVVESTLEAVRSTCVEKQIKLRLQDWSARIPFRIMGDPNRVRQILLNLLSNAIKFTPPTGRIVVQSKLLAQSHPTIQEYLSSLLPKKKEEEEEDNDSPKTESSGHGGTSAGANGTTTVTTQWVYIAVTDSGKGIDPANQTRIFQRYQQEHSSVARTHGGTGLGLSICQLLLKSMGGVIGVQSQLGVGSTFWFVLPVRPIPQSPPATPSSPLRMSLIRGGNPHDESSSSLFLSPTFRILVAEDNQINQKLIARMLTRLGHKATIAKNGQVAIEMLQAANSPDSSTDDSFDLVLMDVQMPVMDGLEATRRLRTVLGYTELPILALTASVKQHDFLDLGFTDWLAKPTKLGELKDKILRCQGYE